MPLLSLTQFLISKKNSESKSSFRYGNIGVLDHPTTSFVKRDQRKIIIKDHLFLKPESKKVAISNTNNSNSSKYVPDCCFDINTLTTDLQSPFLSYLTARRLGPFLKVSLAL